ncbi:MAG: hypothetical protein E7481_07935 [Ruminococcaceae bacterium]|nr:hypothetical protein [Oscillospiraceae bacterium]MBQ2915469.1 hypothetical protein [Clostridia bacterium]
MNKSKANSIINIINICLVLVMLVSLVISVNCYIEQYEKIYRTKQLTAQLEDEINNGEKLRIEYEKRTNIREVEDYAVKVLGLQKYSNYQVEYITYQNTNKTVMFDNDLPQESVLSRVAAVFSIITEYFD